VLQSPVSGLRHTGHTPSIASLEIRRPSVVQEAKEASPVSHSARISHLHPSSALQVSQLVTTSLRPTPASRSASPHSKVPSLPTSRNTSPATSPNPLHQTPVQSWLSMKIGACVAGWYLISFLGIVLNKRLLSDGHTVEPRQLALVQTFTTVLIGGVCEARSRRREVYTIDIDNEEEDSVKKSGTSFMQKLGALALLGLLRFLVIVFGLISLKHVAASFTETVKASGPFFTVLSAYFLLGEKTSCSRMGSLIPVVGGLMLASATELSFTVIGFVAALLTNTVECIQNVFCKQLMTPSPGSTEAPYTAQQLQYYSSVAALLVQIPVFAFQSWLENKPASPETTPGDFDLLDSVSADMDAGFEGVFDHTTVLLLWNGLLYYLQSALAYTVMSYYSPVTVAVLNTAKRAMIICGTAVVFGNHLMPMTQAGTFVCLMGAYLYNYLGSQSGEASRPSGMALPSPKVKVQEELEELLDGEMRNPLDLEKQLKVDHS